MENNMTTKLQIFNDKKVRTVWNADEEDWYFSVVDVVEILSESTQPRKYWNDLKRKLKAEGSQLSEKIGQLKMQSSDGKYYKTDVLNTKGVLRLVQSKLGWRKSAQNAWTKSPILKKQLREGGNIINS